MSKRRGISPDKMAKADQVAAALQHRLDVEVDRVRSHLRNFNGDTTLTVIRVARLLSDGVAKEPELVASVFAAALVRLAKQDPATGANDGAGQSSDPEIGGTQTDINGSGPT